MLYKLTWTIGRIEENLPEYFYYSNQNFNKYYNYTLLYYDEDMNEIRKNWEGQIDAGLHLESINNYCSKEKIEFLYKDFLKGFSIREENS